MNQAEQAKQRVIKQLDNVQTMLGELRRATQIGDRNVVLILANKIEDALANFYIGIYGQESYDQLQHQIASVQLDQIHLSRSNANG